MNNETKIIDLTPYRGRKKRSTAFMGRVQGETVRSVLKLENLEKEYKQIEIKIPLGTTSFNPSFFLGLFYDSIKKFGTIEKFQEKYLFSFDENESNILISILEDNISEALLYAKNSMNDSQKGFRF